MISSSFSLLLVLTFLIFGGFEWVDNIAAGYSSSPILKALIFFGIIILGSDLLSTPFSLYQTFVIEEKYGFNKTTPRTYIFDKLKGYLLGIIIGGILITALLMLIQFIGQSFWIYFWIIIAAFSIFMNIFYTTLIVPL